MIKINLFDRFTIELNGKVYDMHEELGTQLSEIFSTIIYYHKGGISKRSLMEYFWEDSENPANAMKYAIYRLREKLAKMEGFRELEWIVTKKGGYGFNENLEYDFDVDRFNEMILASKAKLSDINKVIELYNGGFLTNNTHLYVHNIRLFYEDLFVQYIVRTCREFASENDYGSVMEVMEKALMVEPLNEDFILIYLRALIESRKYNAALKYFKKVSEDYYNTYKQPIGDRVSNLFDDYMDSDRYVIDDIDDIANLIRVREDRAGPIFVKFLAFKQIYELMFHRYKRMQRSIAIVMVKLVTDHDVDRKMDILKDIIDNNLRASDIYCKLNDDQYLFILVLKDDFDIYAVMSKLQTRFFLKCSRKEVKFQFYNRTIEQIQNYKE